MGRRDDRARALRDRFGVALGLSKGSAAGLANLPLAPEASAQFDTEPLQRSAKRLLALLLQSPSRS